MSDRTPTDAGRNGVTRRTLLKAGGAGATLAAIGAVGGRSVLAEAADVPRHRSAVSDLARTPPMGWNTWGQFEADITEDLVRQQADAMVTSGLRDAGYRYLVIDGGWRAPERDAAGNMQSDPATFPSGIKSLADYVHGKGLKFGLHQPVGVTDGGKRSPGTQTAPGDTYADKARHDASTFAEWGIDFLKFDRNNYVFDAGTLPGAPDVDGLTVRSGTSVVFSREAEARGNVLQGRARITDAPLCSGGKMVEAIGIAGGALTFTDVYVPKPGTYDVDFSFVHVNRGQWEDLGATEPYAVYVSANGHPPQLLQQSVAHPVAGTVFQMTATVTLHGGRNTIRLSNPDSDEEVLRDAFVAMGRALQATGRRVTYSMSGPPRPWLWGRNVANMARIAWDLSPWWDNGIVGQSTPQSVVSTIDLDAPLARYAGPGYWNDPDLLFAGVNRPDSLGRFPGELTDVEGRSQFSMWAMLAAPLMATADLRHATAATLDTLTNPEVIAIDQDRLGDQGRRIRVDGSTEVWVKRLADGDRAVALFNRGSATATIGASAREIGLPAARRYLVRDLWRHTRSRGSGDLSADVPAHGVELFRIRSTH